MPFKVHAAQDLEGLSPGATVQFTLNVGKENSYAEHIQVQQYRGLEVDPLTARRLRLMNEAIEQSPAGVAAGESPEKPLALGDSVPDFVLLDQNGRRTAFSKFAGQTIVLNFVYTRCSLPEFCFRSSNTFRQVQKRFRPQLGTQLILLTVSFDPAHDQPDVLRKYAAIWKADLRTWHFLTGTAPEVRRVCDLFGMDVFQDEGLMNHSLHTAVIDRSGKLVANIEGNQFTAKQLGDLVETVMDQD